jgi:uncharacterized protein YndB with AHSA1/START domain
MIDVFNEIEAVQREVTERPGPAGTVHSVRLQRDLDAPIDDVWDALSNPERIGRWFLPISGDYRLGGHYQFEGNAGGEILECDRPNRLKVSWVYGAMEGGAPSSFVEIRLSALGADRTRFDFEHSAVVPEEMWGQFGPGAVGVGWDGGLLGLALHLRGGSIDDPEAWQVSDEGRAFYAKASNAWGDASLAAGVDPETVTRNIANTTEFYAPTASAGS